MRLLIAGVERLLLLLLGMARVLFILQGFAFGCASAATFAAAGGTVPPWLQGAMAKGLAISGIFFVAGVLLVAARRWRVPPTVVGVAPTWPWPLLLGLSLLVLPAVAALASSGLPPLWSKISHQLRAVGFWDAVGRSDPYGGIVLLPIMAALLVPLLLTAAAAVSVVFPLALLPLLAVRRRLFPTLLAMGTICQVALVLTGWIAVDVLGGLATQAVEAMAADGDAEVLRVGEELTWATGILTRTSLALVAPTLGMLAWLVFLRPSGTAASYFSADIPVPDPARASQIPDSPAPDVWTPVTPSLTPPVASENVPHPRPAAGMLARVAQVGMVALGALMVLFGAANGLRAQATYAGSQPAPGATLMSRPGVVRVTFAASLDPGSSLSLIRLAGHPSDGDGPRDVALTSRLAPDDRDQRTIEGLPVQRLSPGLYRVAWWVRPAGGGGAQQGTFSFGIGVPVPADTPSEIHTLSERTPGARKRRQTVLGGLLLIGLSTMLPWLASRA